MLATLTPQRRAAVAGRWLERIVGRYPPETAKFLTSQQDRFANPVGAALREETVTILDGLLDGQSDEQLQPALDRIIRVRAVQDLAASEAVGFLLDLKELVRIELADEQATQAELPAFDQRVDQVLLAAFDVYAACRNQIKEIQVRSIRKRSLDAMDRLHAWQTRREREPGPGDPEPGDPEPGEPESGDPEPGETAQ